MTTAIAPLCSPAETDACRKAITEVATGGNLGKFLQDIGMPHIRFYELVESIPDLTSDYARAKRSRAELVAQDIVEIADTEEDAQRARNRIQARQWYASKILPKEYGDRMDINVTQTIDIGTALQDARARAVRPVCDQHTTLDAQVVDYKDVSPPGAFDKQSNPAPEPVAPKKRSRPKKGAP